MNKLFSYLNKKVIILISILTLFSTIISVIIPYIIGYIIDHINKKIIYLIIFLLVIYIINFILNIILNRIIINNVEDIIYKIRKDTFNHLEKLPVSYFDKNDKGNMMSILTNDIDKINECLQEVITTIISSVITLIGVTFIMFYMNITLSIIVVLSVPLFFIIVMKMSKKMNEYFNKLQETLGELTSDSEEIVSSIKTIKSLEKQQYFINKFDKTNKKYRDISIKSSIYSYLILPINLIINNLSNILIIGVGAILVLKNNTTIGEIVAFLSYASMFRSPINDISSLIGTIGEAMAGLKRIDNILEEKIENNGKIKLDIKGNIEFKNIYFKYDKKDILKNISFKINKGEKLAIVGETGSGKTTIISLIEKFYDIYKGNILIDNININDIDKKKIRDNIGLVLQDTYLFKGTIMENIKYGRTIDDKKVIKICEDIGVSKFIEKLPNGYYTEIENDANNLSIGEKQLLSIVRCIIKNPKIIILDEATSGVDIKTEKDIYNGIQKLLKNKTSIVIAHRLSTIKNSDKILVLDNGKIKEIGNHNELINKKGTYFNMYMKQFK
ncbi:MAG: ABC transporter ATP-binding protein [Lactobacillales bacterium]|nr:ABC transporter ATP-binding protein [Lactobacillales bacterium]